MQLEPVLHRLHEAVRPLAGVIETQTAPLKLELRRPARPPVIVILQRMLQVPVLLLTDRADHALALGEELELWASETPRLVFPEPTPLFYENAAWGESTRRERLLALSILAAYHIPGAPTLPAPPLIIAPVRAVMTRTLPRADFLKASRTLRRGLHVQIDELVRQWVALGYEAVTTVIGPGQFARRGGILDLWPPAHPQPVRLEFFGDEIETMRRFDPATQRTLKDPNPALQALNEPEKILITPSREFLRPELDGEYSEIDIPRLHPHPASLLDYLPRQALVIVDDGQALEDMVAELEDQAVRLRRDYIKEGTLAEDFPLPYLTWADLEDSLARHKVLELDTGIADQDFPGDAAASDQGDSSGERLSLAQFFTPGPRFGGRLKSVMDYLVEHYLSGEQVVVVSRQSARLSELWIEQTYTHNLRLLAETGRPQPQFIDGSLAEGWTFTPTYGPPLHFLTDGEIFGWRRPKPRYRRSPHYQETSESPETHYSDLFIDDYVVHVDHGIGRYKGMVRRTVENVEREYLCVEFADEAQLFVPVHQVDRLTRYVGPENRSPTLSRLGSAEWRNVKSHVREAVREVAEDLLELYARRSVAEGYRYPPDSTWQEELEASFPYVETEDQLRVLTEVKRDMESTRPMDRLICGDVGYGKTEVALRAAFKAINDGRQVGVLVPTTVLAQQHFNTFQQRLAAFPVEVEMLSRFRTPQQQRDILKRLGDGGVDIVIGTHRMLSSDVRFKDLGLLIIDEEQRFGVTHKETLKKMRTEVDVLTLTATPIPRTLYMALSGIRDISTINTPPEERLPIVTHVGPYSPRLVRQAILRELERGGQIFFVHNRVQTIGAMMSHLNQLVPEARITIAHGQMAEVDLAQRMEQFTNGEIDILLCTSIIESGLDIPNANTLIVDRADTFGLAQLYQLRGRVGRGAQRAYAYFFRHNKKAPTPDGRQRLETIAENTQLGAGLSIAMRDLEIRGTGDILGTQQSGHIAAVGFHLYTRLLAEAVRRLRPERGLAAPAPGEAVLNLPTASLPVVNVELPLPVSIPSDYVPDTVVRLGLYRRIADLRSPAEIDALLEEFSDRFGHPPEMVHNLLFQLRIKLLAEKAGMAAVTAEGGQIVLRFASGSLPERLPPLGEGIRVGKVALWMPYTHRVDWPERLVEALETLAAFEAQPVIPMGPT
jgi:transcription-repair coupling factor (superfamily II helicase)